MNSRTSIPMKGDMCHQTYRLIVLFFIGMLCFACTEENKPGSPPEIHLLSGNDLIDKDTIIAPGQLMQFSIVAQAVEYPITQFLIRVIADSVQVYYDSGMYVQDLDWTGSFAKSFNDNETWEFIVRDRSSVSNQVDIIIGNDTSAGFGPISTLDDILLGAQDNNVDEGFLSLQSGLAYFAEEAKNHQEEIEMIYYYLAADGNVIAAPGSNIEEEVFGPELTPVNWEYRNTTRFLKTDITSQQFDTIENDSLLIVSYTEGEGKRKAKLLEAGDIYSFKTQESKFGLFRVNQLSGTTDGNVEIDIKIQQ